MYILVPLAGPDFLRSDGSLKGLKEFRGQPLIKEMLQTRQWYRSTEKYIFILQDHEACRSFFKEKLKNWFPDSQCVFITANTRGAAFSALAGASLVHNPAEPLVVDLADIYFEIKPPFMLDNFVQGKLHNGGFTFVSNSENYSYLKFDSEGNFIQACEKKVISDRASAGVYYFENVKTYIDSLSWYTCNEQTYCHNRLFYVCPMLTGIKELGHQVTEVEVESVYDPKLGQSEVNL